MINQSINSFDHVDILARIVLADDIYLFTTKKQVICFIRTQNKLFCVSFIILKSIQHHFCIDINSFVMDISLYSAGIVLLKDLRKT